MNKRYDLGGETNFILAPKNKYGYKIIVNGKEKIVRKNRYSCKQIIKFALGNVDFCHFFVVFEKSDDWKEAGILAPWESVTIKDGTTFLVKEGDGL